MLKSSRSGMFAPSPRQNRGWGVFGRSDDPKWGAAPPAPLRAAVGKRVKNKGLWPYPSALSPDRQTRYELAGIFSSAVARALGGNPWQPRQNSRDHSPPWSRH